MKKLVWFWIVYGVFLAALFAGVLFVEKAELHLLLSQWVADCSKACTDVADWFMKNLTEIGSSFPFVVVGVCLFLKFGYSYVLLLGQGNDHQHADRADKKSPPEIACLIMPLHGRDPAKLHGYKVPKNNNDDRAEKNKSSHISVSSSNRNEMLTPL